MYECFHCGHRSVIWQADFSYEDFGLEGEGIVQVCKCSDCILLIKLNCIYKCV